MQPTLIICSPHPGVIYINGAFAGEAGPDRPLIRPIAGWGALYLEYRPLSGTHREMARRIVLSGGEPLPESIESAEGLSAVIWPGGEIELELTPQSDAQVREFTLGGRSFQLDAASGRLYLEGRPIGTLPPEADVPELRITGGGAALSGACADGRYLLSMDARLETQTGFLRAKQIDLEENGRIRAVVAQQDLAGHASLETWRLEPDGLKLISSEPAWAQGAPLRPQTPAETARAAVEAALLGLTAEADAYLTPALRSRAPLAGIAERCDLCLDMKYALPSGRDSVALLKLESDNCARVRPMYFRAVAGGGAQGPYLIDAVEFG